MMKIDEILSRLQEQQPAISNPDELTDRIMDSLPDLDAEQPTPARRIRLYTALALAAAASILLLLTLQLNNQVEPKASQPIVAQQTEQRDSTTKTEVKQQIEEAPLVAQVTPVKPIRKAKKKTNIQPPAPHTETAQAVNMVVADPAEQIEREYRAEASAIRQRGDQVMLHVAMLSEQQVDRMQYVEF